MTVLPLALSVPHAGLVTPPELVSLSVLTAVEVVADGDEGAAEIYFPLRSAVAVFETSEVARAFVDLNRAADDIRKDGVIKTHTCWDVPIYRRTPDDTLVRELLEHYHAPYHARLSRFAERDDIVLAIDCHTMAEFGPPVGPDPGVRRPLICLGNAHGASCPNAWALGLREELETAFGEDVTLNEPFSGGYITRFHGREMPWIQLEFSRSARFTNTQKSSYLMSALTRWCERQTEEPVVVAP